MADTIKSLGSIIKDQDAAKDAIHIAIAPVVAAITLGVGEHVGFIDGSCEKVSIRAAVHIGIVDPFLRTSVMAGERFWLFLYPGTITSLRHDWTHPAFTGAPSKEDVAFLDWLRSVNRRPVMRAYDKG